jgi:hypothetical protein
MPASCKDASLTERGRRARLLPNAGWKPAFLWVAPLAHASARLLTSRHAHAALAGAYLLATLATPVPSVMADTVISAPAPRDQQKDPPPRAVPLCLGQAIVRVDFSKANFDKELAKLTAQPCLLMGLINGRVVAADVDQNDQKKPTFNKLFMVDLLDSKTASFSGLLEDCVAITPSPSGQTLANYANKDIAYSRDPWFNRRGQLLQWALPSLDPQKPENIRQYVLMTDGYQKGCIDLWALEPDPVTPGSPITTNKVKLTFKTKKLLGNYQNLKGADLYVNALDCIDLNQFKTDDNGTTYPKALMVWCKPNGCAGYDNLQLSAPVYLVSCALDNDSDTPIPVNDMVDFGIKCYQKAGHQKNEWANVVGGFVVAPTRDGKLRYWCARSEGNISGDYWFTCYLKAVSMPIVYDSTGKFVSVRRDCKVESGFGRHEWTSVSDDDQRHTMTRQYNVENPGLGFTFDNDADKTVRLNACVFPSKEFKDIHVKDNNDKIGVTETLSPEETANLNKSVTINGGKVNMSDLQARLTRLKRCQGVQVLRVLLGWPYVAMPDNQDPSKSEGPSVVISNSNTTIDQGSFNNGLSCSLEVGYQTGVDKMWSAAVGVKAGYEYKYDHMSNNSFTIAEQAGYKTLQGVSDAEGAKKAYASGAVFVSKVMPNFTRISKVEKSKTEPFLKIEGDTANFFCPAVSMQLAPVGESASNVTMIPFLNSDPSNVGQLLTYSDWEDGKRNSPLPGFQTDYAAMADGLLKKPLGSLLSYKTDADFNAKLDAIRDWQDKNPLVDDLQSFCNDGGVTPYGRPGGTNPGCYASNFNNSKSLSITTGSTDVVTRSHQGYVGLWFEFSYHPLGGIKGKGDCLFKTGSSTVHSKSETNAFTLNQPGLSNSPYERWYYFFNIDVPAMKSYMLSHSYKLRCSSVPEKTDFKNEAVRPSFVPKYCWDMNQSFVLGFPWIPPKGVNEEPTASLSMADPVINR